MVAEILRVPVEIFSSRSSGGTSGLLDVSMSGGFLNVSMIDSIDTFLFSFYLAFCEGVLYFVSFLEIFPFYFGL